MKISQICVLGLFLCTAVFGEEAQEKPDLTETFKLAKQKSWNFNFENYERSLPIKKHTDKDEAKMLRQVDPTRKTEYFNKVLRMPLPENARGSDKPKEPKLSFTFEWD
jgi:hypothetical protein